MNEYPVVTPTLAAAEAVIFENGTQLGKANVLGVSPYRLKPLVPCGQSPAAHRGSRMIPPAVLDCYNEGQTQEAGMRERAIQAALDPPAGRRRH